MKYPIGYRSAHTLEELQALRKACTLEFYHGPHLYDLPDAESVSRQGPSRDFMFAAHAAMPDMILDLQNLQAAALEVVTMEFRYCDDDQSIDLSDLQATINRLQSAARITDDQVKEAARRAK